MDYLRLPVYSPYPSAAFTYETQQFDEAVRKRVEEGMLSWRAIIELRLQEIMAKYPAKLDVEIESLADMFTSSVEGGIILARAYNDNQALIDQVQNYRSHLRMLFEPA